MKIKINPPIMKQFILFFSLMTLLLSNVHAQQSYFQQEVNYKIDVTLIDSIHLLRGTAQVEYVNNSPDELSELYFHIWGNAFKNRNTAFVKQQLRLRNTEMFFADTSDLGSYKTIDFKIGDQILEWRDYDKNPDIVLLQLPKPLPSGERITLTIPFVLDIPASFSRLGHVGTSYQMTQWYPKPAVYDKDGWHPMPYLNMGEFYQEFGDYDVRITLPENYVVAATGTLQTESEQQFLGEKVKATNQLIEKGFETSRAFPASAKTMKTIRYTAEKVIDFAWFADKRFHVQNKTTKLSTGKEVESWTYFTNFQADKWSKAIDYVDRSLHHYSDLVGEYPYPQATAVQSALSAGGGMEYPMITVIGAAGSDQGLDEVITHEVGHNWFYGILAFDERDHPWMDEGINSYYDHRYTDLYYPSRNNMLPDFLYKGSDYGEGEIAYTTLARLHKDQAPQTHSDDFTLINYFLSAYEKPAIVFRHLEKYLGTEVFDKTMKSFYSRWKFTHPQPEDFRRHLENQTGKDLSWFFDGFIESNRQMNYKIKNVEGNQVTIENIGEIPAPFPIQGVKDDSILSVQWVDGFSGMQTISFADKDYDWVVIDENKITLDVNKSNNNYRPNNLLKKIEPLQLNFFAGVGNSKKNTLYWLPTVLYNNYDGIMTGVTLYNGILPSKKFEFAVTPVYAFDSKQLNGLAFGQVNLFPASDKIDRISIGVSGKRFSHNLNTNDGRNVHQNYFKLMPYINVELHRDPTKNYFHRLKFRTLRLGEEVLDFDNDGMYSGNSTVKSWIHELSYEGELKRAINPLAFKIALEQQSYDDPFGNAQSYLKASLELISNFTYDEGKNISFRFFMGTFLANTRRNTNSFHNAPDPLSRGSFALLHQGFNDYKYDDAFIGRRDISGFDGHQVTRREGGFKNAFGRAQSAGMSNDFIAALNVKADLPMNVPLLAQLKPYIDLGYFKMADTGGPEPTFEDQFMMSGGIMLEIIERGLSIHFPLFHSENIKQLNNQLEAGKYGARITYTVNVNKVNPWKASKRLIEF